ncbi:hypothetical protein [Flavobacterium sp. ENC]|uniref:hypothetical protein n=1 Tax=Flavobacterium sp. ENC TaxID=2897330 RepID=UPI001E643B46|nr:hypothetical protein [Flavobacterium sp. ENC]MCD0466289.1 hypothetical protein [Flavobacterium sp. ENC]
MNIVIENKGIKTDSFYVPAFVLLESEVVVLYLFGGGYYYDTEMFLKDIFCGNIKHENVTTNKRMMFVDYFRESNFIDVFFPSKVNRYVKKDADLTNPFLVKLFEDKYVTRKTKMNSLGGTQRKLISLYVAFSKTKDIIFDLAGLDAQGAELTFKLVKEAVKNGGSAILLDNFPDMKEHASKYIQLEWNKDKLPPTKEFKFNF